MFPSASAGDGGTQGQTEIRCHSQEPVKVKTDLMAAAHFTTEALLSQIQEYNSFVRWFISYACQSIASGEIVH